MISVKAAQLLCFLLVLLASASAAEMCGPGHFLDGTTCKECPPGTFQYQSNADSCIPCSAGTFTPGLGAQVANLCIECPENSISSAGSGSCTPCPSESYANRDQTKCVNCPPGQHLEYDDFCVPCRPGFYRPDRSSSSCAVCPKGYDSEEGATACHKIPPCPLGYEVDRNDCQKCFFNYFRGEDMERCEECPLYTVSSRGAAECKGCPAGQFLKGSRCENCPSGSKTVGEGGIVCRIDNALCPVSYFEKSNGDCHTCYPGYRLDLLTNQCTQCAENEFSPGGVVPVLRPRAFSIASSANAHPGSVHICASLVKYQTPLRFLRVGVCSAFFKSLKKGDCVPIFLEQGTSLRFQTKRPAILIGPGTGVAPMRSYLSEGGSTTGPSILFFGCRSEKGDFLYRRDFELFLKRKTLTKLITAFSREDPSQKVYVQHRIEHNAEQTWKLVFEQGAYVYVAGAAGAMPKAIREVIVTLGKTVGQLSEASSEQFVKRMESEGRLQMECW